MCELDQRWEGIANETAAPRLDLAGEMRKWENLGKLYKTLFLGWPWTLDAEDSQLYGRKNNTNWEGPPFRTHFGPISPHFGTSFFQVRQRGAPSASGLAMCAMARRCKRWARLVDSLLATETLPDVVVVTPSFRLKKFHVAVKSVDQKWSYVPRWM